MSTKDKSLQIARHFVTLRDLGLTGEGSLARIAKDSNTDRDTILRAIAYALAG